MSAFYSDIRTVRLRNGFHTEETPSGQDGNVVKLDDNAYGILLVEKNGTKLFDPTDYSFIRPVTLNMVVAVIATDIMLVWGSTKLPEETMVDVMIDATSVTDGILVRSHGEASLARWKTRVADLALGGTGDFIIGEAVEGQTSGARGEIVEIDLTASKPFIRFTPIGDLTKVMKNNEMIIGDDSLANWSTSFPSGIITPISQAPSLVDQITKDLGGCYAWEAFWEKDHMIDSEMYDIQQKKMKYLYEKLKKIDTGEIRLPGEKRTGSTDRPAIGRPRTGPFRKDSDLDLFDYATDILPYRRRRPHS